MGGVANEVEVGYKMKQCVIRKTQDQVWSPTVMQVNFKTSEDFIQPIFNMNLAAELNAISPTFPGSSSGLKDHLF